MSSRVFRWIIVFDSSKVEAAASKDVARWRCDKILTMEFSSASSVFGNGQRNHALAHIAGRASEFEDSYIYFLDDDNVVHPELWNLELDEACDRLYSFDQYWGLPGKEILKGDCPKINEIDTAQVLIGARAYLREPILWLEHAHEADGMFIEQMFANHPHSYIPRIASLYNPLRGVGVSNYGADVVPHPSWFNLKIRPMVGLVESMVEMAKNVAAEFPFPCTLLYLGHTCRGLAMSLIERKRGHVRAFAAATATTASEVIVILEPTTLTTNFALPPHHKVVAIAPPASSERSPPTIFGRPMPAARDNLVNICIMVKNGGETFERVLRENMPFADRWTILDTGSTDGTQDVVRRVLEGQEYTLAEEPFVNFRDSRNRCLDLAGTKCKYNIMLDDTYILRGDVRKFLAEVRGDEFATSFCLFIQSDDVEYQSNRVTPSAARLRYMYTIHEVIQTERNERPVLIPSDCAYIEDLRSDYMEKRTMARKRYDIEKLEEMIKEDPDNPRHLYYMAQTYNLLGDHENAALYFKKRFDDPRGLLQERVDAGFEYARTLNFKQDAPWEEVEKVYREVYELEPARPDALYFIGVHYMNSNPRLAFDEMRKAFALGYPQHTQFSLKPTLSFYFLPKFLAPLCYQFEDYALGIEACERFMSHLHDPPVARVVEEADVVQLRQLQSWFKHLLAYQAAPIVPSLRHMTPCIAFVVDGNWTEWSPQDLETKGLGGSETWAVELSRAMRVQLLQNAVGVFVFCRTPASQLFEGVTYHPISKLYSFLKSSPFILSCIVSRFPEYLPLATYVPHVQSVYFVMHDVATANTMIPKHPKIKHVVCLTHWHAAQFLSVFESSGFQPIVIPYGSPTISRGAARRDDDRPMALKRFIYPSFPNRGLLPLLRMWPRITALIPDAELHVFADLDGAWVNSVDPMGMREVRDRAKAATGVHVRGWVGKAQLYEEWRKADVWVYPCTFEETFCMTAVEAACSKTLAITTPLAGLAETAKYAIQVPGDASTEEWADEVLRILGDLLKNDEGKRTHTNSVTHNYARATHNPWAKVVRKWIHVLRIPQELTSPRVTFVPGMGASNRLIHKTIMEIQTKNHAPRILEFRAGSTTVAKATLSIDVLQEELTNVILGFDDDAFDVGFALNAPLQEMREVQVCISEFVRVCKAGVIVFPSIYIEGLKGVRGGEQARGAHEGNGYGDSKYVFWVDGATNTLHCTHKIHVDNDHHLRRKEDEIMDIAWAECNSLAWTTVYRWDKGSSTHLPRLEFHNWDSTKATALLAAARETQHLTTLALQESIYPATHHYHKTAASPGQGLCNQLYGLVKCICNVLGKRDVNERLIKIHASPFMREVHTDCFRPLSEILDLPAMNSALLSKYNVCIVDAGADDIEELYHGFTSVHNDEGDLFWEVLHHLEFNDSWHTIAKENVRRAAREKNIAEPCHPVHVRLEADMMEEMARQKGCTPSTALVHCRNVLMRAILDSVPKGANCFLMADTIDPHVNAFLTKQHGANVWITPDDIKQGFMREERAIIDLVSAIYMSSAPAIVNFESTFSYLLAHLLKESSASFAFLK
jgi:glycosyltransferase involved in cell wall biosynthesis/tetratricopeptide (TPR) repeat protein